MLGRLAAPVLLLLVAVSLAPLVAAADAPADFVVGFRGLPKEAREGSYQNEKVERVDEALGFLVVKAKAARAFEARAKHDPSVRYVQRENVATADFVPNDPVYPQQFAWTKLNAAAAWDVTRGSKSITVAVIDTGVDAAHPDLSPNLLPGWDFLNNDATPNDDCGHGTGVAGVIAAAQNNGIGTSGAAQVNVMPLKVMGINSAGSCVGPFSAVASAIRYAADNGARVISMSLGCPGCYDQPTNDAIEYAWGKGVLLVGSAGNNGPCASCVSWPAAQPHVMAVACTDSGNSACYFSSSGPEVDLAAPGKSIQTTYRNGAYGIMSGTSIAAPHVSGAAALALSANLSLTNADLWSRLTGTAKDLGAAGHDQSTGSGLLDMGKLLAGVGSAPPPPPAPTPPPNQPPTASFTAAGGVLSASVDGSASRDPDGAIASWAWAWGDGSAGAGATATHAYAAGGTYVITLTVTDNQGATAATSGSVTVAAPNQPPTASFTSAASGLTASADASGSRDTDGAIVSYAWAWGDGSTSAGATASHAYASGGTYTVTLTVTDDRGATATTSAGVTVQAPPPPPAPSPPPATNALHAGDIAASAKPFGSGQRLTWDVPVLGSNGARFGGATVWATIALPGGTSKTMGAVASSAGLASFRLDVPAGAGVTYTLCVSTMVKSGYSYDAAANVETCQAVQTG